MYIAWLRAFGFPKGQFAQGGFSAEQPSVVARWFSSGMMNLILCLIVGFLYGLREEVTE